jgi:PKD repeat protein
MPGIHWIPYGGNRTYTITADPIHHITDVLVNGQSVGTFGRGSHTFEYEFLNVTSNQLIEAFFHIDWYIVQVTAQGGTVTGGGIYDHGTQVTVRATANTGYTFVNWTEGGQVVSANQEYTFNAESDRTLVANFILKPIADFMGSPTLGKVPLTVYFEDLSTGEITSWYWDFGDAGISTAQNPTHTYNTPDTYTVSLTVTGPGGSDTETKIDYITVSDVCEGDFDGDGDVDGSDLAVFAADFGRTDCCEPGAEPCEGDFDGDCDVDGSDLAVFAADFGRTDCP